MKAGNASRTLRASRRDSQIPGLVFCLPFIIGCLLVFFPIVFEGIRFAFSDVSVEGGLNMKFVGLKNFNYILRVDAEYGGYLAENLRSLITTLPIIIIFSLFVAVLLNTDVWGRGIFRALFFLPVIACVGLLAAQDSNNTVMQIMSTAASEGANEAISSLSDVENILQSLKFSPELIEVVSSAANNILDIVNRSGVQILIFLAGIQSISPSIYEAARVEGAGAWEIFWKITLPMIVPMMAVNVVFTFLESITRESTTLVYYMKSVNDYGTSAAMAWFHFLMLLIMLGLLFLVYRLCLRVAERSKGAY